MTTLQNEKGVSCRAHAPQKEVSNSSGDDGTTASVANQVEIDAEFQALIAPLNADEVRQLEENLAADGCREPLVLWRGILLDGHHRHAICTRRGIPFQTVTVDLVDRDAAIAWIEHNQLGRRNLHPDAFRVLLGRRYNRQKAQGRRTDLTSRQSEEKWSTGERLGVQHGVSKSTVERAGALVADIEAAAPEKLAAVLKGEERLPNVIREIARAKLREKLDDLRTREVKAVEGVYDVVVIDPPWPIEKSWYSRACRPSQAGVGYPTLSEEEIAALTIPAADDCHVWVWTTHRFLPTALRLLEHWGLKYCCTFTWHKPGGFQVTGLPQFNCEFAIYARRGNPQFIDTTAFFTCFDAPRTGHSQKPEAFYDVVRRVTAGRRLDMFGRRAIEGFEAWGNEAPSAAQGGAA